MVYVWLGLIVAFIAVEAATVNLVSIWFIGGSVAGPVCAILGAPTLLQVAVFILVSALLLALLRPLLKNICASSPPEQTPTGCSDRRRWSRRTLTTSAKRARFA